MKILIQGKKIEKDKLKQRIINSYENYQEESIIVLDGIENEKEIKECDIYINDKKINFTYYYKFPYEGNYTIKYIFKKLLKSTNNMFSDCKIINIIEFIKL